MIVRNFFDAPRGRAENDGVALAAFENHFFIEFAAPRAARCAGQKDAVESAIGNGATVDDVLGSWDSLVRGTCITLQGQIVPAGFKWMTRAWTRPTGPFLRACVAGC